MTSKTDYDIKTFKSQHEWETWLDTHHTSVLGVWLRFFKKATGKQTFNYDEALEVALCYGWIDSQTKKYDEKSYLQKFTPRGPKSIWSKVNVGHIERLIKAGKLKPFGLQKVEEAKKDGRWQKAYDSPSVSVVPEDFLKELRKNKKALAFFESLNKTNIYAITWRLQTAKKPETREKRMNAILEMLAKGEKLH